jgi:hypothetical protein
MAVSNGMSVEPKSVQSHYSLKVELMLQGSDAELPHQGEVKLEHLGD